MSSDFKITCPHCKNELSSKDFLEVQLDDLKKELENQKKDFEYKIEKKIKSNYEMQNKKIIEDEKIKLTKDLRKKIEEENKESKKLELQKLEFIENEKKKNEDLLKSQIEKFKNENDSLKKEFEIENRRMKKKMDELEDITKKKDVQLQGEIQEELIEDFLKKNFKDDDVIEIKKGSSGGDCILQINDKSKTNIARIYFESKNTKSFSEQWIPKFLDDMNKKRIANGFLISKTLPNNFDQKLKYQARHGGAIVILPFEFSIINAYVRALREQLLYNYNLSTQNSISKQPLSSEIKQKNDLWMHITSPTFLLQLKTLYQGKKKTLDLIEKQNDMHNRMNAKLEREIKSWEGTFKDLILQFSRISDNLLPDNLLDNSNIEN